MGGDRVGGLSKVENKMCTGRKEENERELIRKMWKVEDHEFIGATVCEYR